MGAKSSPARSQEARANAKADRRSGGPAGAPCRAHRQGLPKVWAEICSQPNQSAISGSFFGTKYWKCAESDDGNPKKSMILHRMVPSAPLWPGFQPSDGDYVFMCLAPSFLRSPAVRVTRIRCAADTYRDVARAPAWHQTLRRPRVTRDAADALRDCGRDAPLPAAAAVAVHAGAASPG